MMIKGAIFDLDGTLVDSVPDIASAANLALRHLGLRTFSVSEYKKFAGGGHWRLLTTAITLAQNGVPPSPEMLEKAVAIKKSQEDGPHGHDHTTAYEGVHEMLRKLQNDGVQLAILSNKGEPTVRNIVSTVFPDIKFRHVAGQRDDTPMKPDPFAALRIIEKHFDADVTPKDVVFVGDTDIDMKTGTAAGCTPVAVPWGCRKKEELLANGAKQVIRSCDDLIKIVNGASSGPVTSVIY